MQLPSRLHSRSSIVPIQTLTGGAASRNGRNGTAAGKSSSPEADGSVMDQGSVEHQEQQQQQQQCITQKEGWVDTYPTKGKAGPNTDRDSLDGTHSSPEQSLPSSEMEQNVFPIRSQSHTANLPLPAIVPAPAAHRNHARNRARQQQQQQQQQQQGAGHKLDASRHKHKLCAVLDELESMVTSPHPSRNQGQQQQTTSSSKISSNSSLPLQGATTQQQQQQQQQLDMNVAFESIPSSPVCSYQAIRRCRSVQHLQRLLSQHRQQLEVGHVSAIAKRLAQIQVSPTATHNPASATAPFPKINDSRSRSRGSSPRSSPTASVDGGLLEPRPSLPLTGEKLQLGAASSHQLGPAPVPPLEQASEPVLRLWSVLLDKMLFLAPLASVQQAADMLQVRKENVRKEKACVCVCVCVCV